MPPWPTARSASSRTRSISRPGTPWAPAPGERLSVPTRIDRAAKAVPRGCIDRGAGTPAPFHPGGFMPKTILKVCCLALLVAGCGPSNQPRTTDQVDQDNLAQVGEL